MQEDAMPSESYHDALSLCDEMATCGERVLGAEPTIYGGLRGRRGRAYIPGQFQLGCGALAWSTKLLRSIIILCKEGRSAEADVLLRSLWEAYLTTNFLLKPRLTIDGRSVSRKMRAKIYQASSSFVRFNMVEKWKKEPGMKRLAAEYAGGQSKLTEDLHNAEKLLGKEWSAYYRNKTSYRGMSIESLARQIPGAMKDYISIYSLLSATAHGADVYRHIDAHTSRIEFAPHWSASASTLGVAAALYGAILKLSNDQLDLGVNKRLNEFLSRLRQRASDRRAARKQGRKKRKGTSSGGGIRVSS